MCAQFTFEKIIDENTTFPGNVTKLTRFDYPVFKNGKIAFRSRESNNYTGIYVYEDGKISLIISSDNSTLLEDNRKIESLSGPAFNGEMIAFSGADDGGGRWIYEFGDGKFNKVVDLETNFSECAEFPADQVHRSFENLHLNDDVIVFSHHVSDFTDFSVCSSIHKYSGGILEKVIDEETPIPGGTGSFNLGHMQFYQIASNSQKVAFPYRQTLNIYENGQLNTFLKLKIPIDYSEFLSSEILTHEEQLERLISTGIVNPDEETVYFQQFLSIDIDDGGRIVFRGVIRQPFINPQANAFVHDGIYIYDHGKIIKITENSGTHQAFIDNGNVVLRNSGGISFYSGGRMTKVIGPDDTLEGKKISSLDLSKGALSNDTIVFKVVFDDDDRTNAIYLAKNTPSIPKYEVNLERGWNQIGGPVKTVKTDDLKASVRIWPWFIHYENRQFKRASTLEYGKGYWLYSFEDGVLTIKDE